MSDNDHAQPWRHRCQTRSHRTWCSWPGAALLWGTRSIIRRLFRLHVEGDHRVPATGPAIIAANHLSFFDHIALVVAVRRRLSFVGKVEYLDSWKTRRVLPALGMIPVDRDNPRRAWGALERAAGVLEDDELFAIYPEGTRSRDGALQAGHTGVGHLERDHGGDDHPDRDRWDRPHPASRLPTARARSRRPSYASVPPSILPPTRAPAVSDGDGSPVT